jgi:lipopolysaccharide assembly outer membrane protein LptD (OstA)
VKYASQDSIILNMANRKILLFEDAKTLYEDIELCAAFIEFGFMNNELYASGIADSCGHIHGPPIFKQGGTEFCAQEMRYNFTTQKAKVTKVITVEGDGFIHGYYVKHVDKKVSYIRGGQYTTCNLEHPHFQIRFGKGKVIQDDKIVTGPAYLSFGNIPSPIALPFSMFPLEKERSSGIVIPKFGQSTARGFYFEDFGYYLGINDHFDLLLSGDITTRLNWAAKAKANYVFRYKCNGEIKLNFYQNFFGERGAYDYYHKEDFHVFWTHNQDPKSHPTTRFSAHVDVRSTTQNKYNPSTPSDYLSNEFVSSLNFSTNIKNFFYFDAAVYYNQNTSSRNINLSLPAINMSVRQLYPFR